MATTHWFECRTCGGQVPGGRLDTPSSEPRRLGMTTCAACVAIDRKPRTPITLAAAVEAARRRVGEGYTVHLRDVETKRTITIRDAATAAHLDVREPGRLYLMVAVR